MEDWLHQTSNGPSVIRFAVIVNSSTESAGRPLTELRQYPPTLRTRAPRWWSRPARIHPVDRPWPENPRRFQCLL